MSLKWSEVKKGQTVSIEMPGRKVTIKKVDPDFGEITKDPSYPTRVGLKLYPTSLPGEINPVKTAKPKVKTATPKKVKPKKAPVKKSTIKKSK